MEHAQSYNPETNKPTKSGYSATTPSESKSAESSSATRDRERGAKSQISHDLVDRGAEFYDQAKETVSEAYNKTTETLNKTYDQVMAYGRENPGKFMLIAFAGGIVIGLMLASRSRGSRRPVVNALSQIASEFFS